MGLGGGWIVDVDRDRAFVNPVVEPMDRDPRLAGDLRHRQGAGDA